MNVKTQSNSNDDFWFGKVDSVVVRDKTLSQTAKHVFTILCTFADKDKDKRGCWPSNETVAEAACVSVRTLIRAYKELENRGIITRESRFSDDQQISSYTLIVGHNAPCYGGDTDDRAGVSPMSYRTRINERDIKDSFTRETEIPNLADMPLTFENKQPVKPEESHKPNSPKEIYTPDDAPDIMKPTAELFLHKTGRQGLTCEEISALRGLASTQYPSRVQKEIDTACERFTRKGRLLNSLTLSYIAGSLQNQPTLGKKRKPNLKAKPPKNRVCSDEQAEAEMAQIEALQAEFDREARI